MKLINKNKNFGSFQTDSLNQPFLLEFQKVLNFIFENYLYVTFIYNDGN